MSESSKPAAESSWRRARVVSQFGLLAVLEQVDEDVVIAVSLLVTCHRGFAFTRASLFKTLKQPAGSAVTRPSSSSRSNSDDTCSADKPARAHSESTSTGSCPHVRKQARGNLVARAGFHRRRVAAAPEPGQLSEHVLCRLDELAPRFDERVTALKREWIEPGMANTSRPWSAAGARGNERAGGERRLDHQAALRQPADQAVAAREVVRKRRGAERESLTRSPRSAIAATSSTLRLG